MRTTNKVTLVIMLLSLLAGCTSQAGYADKSNGNFNASGRITVVSREDGSGTRGAFIELVGIEDKDINGSKVDRTTDEAIIVNSTSIVMTTVSGNPYAIGYISLGSLNDTVKAVKVDSVEASVENIQNDLYKVARPFNIAPKKNPSELVMDFINYILSSEGRQIIEKNGYIPVSDIQGYTSLKLSGKITIAGSSSVTPVMEKLKEAYKTVNPNADIELQLSDSSTGMSSAINGTCDIGMASRELKSSELEKGLVPIVMAMDGIAVIVNRENPADNLTTDQIHSIFTGETESWNEFVQ